MQIWFILQVPPPQAGRSRGRCCYPCVTKLLWISIATGLYHFLYLLHKARHAFECSVLFSDHGNILIRV